MTYSLQFTERMIGAFTFAESDYVAGYQVGQQNGTGLQFHLTIATGDVHAMIANSAHPAIPQGYVKCDALGGRLPVQQGTFDLFVAEGSTTRHMLYRLYFSDSTGRHLTLTGFKDVSPGPLRAIWAETSTLYTRILAGHVPVTDGGWSVTDGIVGSGILRIRPLDFAWQLTTFRVHGPTWSGRLKAFDEFGGMFLAELWQVFNPIRRILRRG